MKHSYRSVAFSTCLALGLTFGSAAMASAATEDGPAPQATTSAQSHIAETTSKLEKAFADQFVKGQIDRAALSDQINDVIQAMPQAARPKVQQHIDEVLQAGQKLASELTPEQRSQVAAAPSQVGHLEWGLVNAWGYPAAYGWGGLGAFAFPGMYSFGYPTFTGYGYGVGYNTAYGSSYGSVCGLYGCYGLGTGGWYW